MKASELKKIIKESVREAIQEELKDILLEAVKSPKSTPINESRNIDIVNHTPSISSKEKYTDILNEMTMNFTSKDVPQKFTPQGSMDTTSPNGKLPDGDVGMDQIMGLMTGK
jgi:hypothetical protein|tara:strand:- start:405 stop:740 length:336 start_codon:yes stop_codon:yes gene_type:complete